MYLEKPRASIGALGSFSSRRIARNLITSAACVYGIANHSKGERAAGNTFLSPSPGSDKT